MSTMREARIVMPIAGNGVDARAADTAHDELRSQLCDAFGGFTQTYGVGGWVDDWKTVTEPVAVYDVAMVNIDRNRIKLGNIALAAGEALGQKAVYIRYADGDVRIADVKTNATADERAPSAAARAEEYDLACEGQPGLRQAGVAAREAEAVATSALLGAKRLPAVGDVWQARDGTRVAVLKGSTLLDGGYDCVTLSQGSTALKVGYFIVVDLDGRYVRGTPKENHPLDLVKFVTRFAD